MGLQIFNIFSSSCLSPVVFDDVGMSEGGDRVTICPVMVCPVMVTHKHLSL